MKSQHQPQTAPPADQWHVLSTDDVLALLETPDRGLTNVQASERLHRFGRNVLPARHTPTLLQIYFHQFFSPLIYILLAAGVVAILMGAVTDAVFILGIVIFNAALGAFQEWKAERNAAGLQQLLQVNARVRRSGVTAEINAEELVPGDLVYLESGAMVPADMRILHTNNLTADEALLTGESVAVEKRTNTLADKLPLGDRRNMAFAGSMVVTGRGYGVVVATGLSTEVGKIAGSVTSASVAKPPLVIRMEKFSRQVSLAVLLACVLLGAVAFSQGMTLIQVFFLGVALAVAAIPEGLPIAMTVALSIATSRMAKRNVIVRKLTAVEGLGSCTFIATDKTGTLTLNKQTVERVWLPAAEAAGISAYQNRADFIPLLPNKRQLDELSRLTVICNEATVRRDSDGWHFSGDAVDVAFWNLALQLGIDPGCVTTLQRVGEIPFESDRAYAATFFVSDGILSAAVKGAPEAILGRCIGQQTIDGAGTLNRSAIEAEITALTASGYRVLAVASGTLRHAPPARPLQEHDLPPLTFIGLAGLIDPPRLEVKDAITTCQKAGIELAMITGDHPLTSLAVARAVGMDVEGDQVITGHGLAEAGSPDSPEFANAVQHARVFARVSPLQKVHIVDALIKQGHFVAVTGDGVNDAPALKRAHIGIAMGSGSDVSKEAGSIIITDNNFASIVAGVEEGRFAYGNIRKVVYLLISSGFAEIMLVALAILSGLPLPLLPVQLLWLNLATNGIQDVALAFEAGEPGALRRPPRKPAEAMFNRLMVRQSIVSGTTMALVAYANFYFMLNYLGMTEFEARSRLLLLMVLLENFHVFNCRSEYVSAFRIPLHRNWMLVWGVLGAQGLHLLAMFTPLGQKVLHTAPVGLWEWLVPFLMAALVLAAMELFKRIQHGRGVAYPAPDAEQH